MSEAHERSWSSRTDSNSEGEMAEASWRYMIHNLPSLFNDIKFVNNAIPLWQSKSAASESEWTKQLLSSIDDSASPYSRLPSHIKKGLKTYLTSYKKSTDYSDYIKFQNSLVGKPQITRFVNGGINILRITGGHLSLSGVFTLSELADLKGIDEIQILATETMFLDRNTRFPGKNIVITGKKIDVTAPVVINAQASMLYRILRRMQGTAAHSVIPLRALVITGRMESQTGGALAMYILKQAK